MSLCLCQKLVLTTVNCLHGLMSACNCDRYNNHNFGAVLDALNTWHPCPATVHAGIVHSMQTAAHIVAVDTSVMLHFLSAHKSCHQERTHESHQNATFIDAHEAFLFMNAEQGIITALHMQGVQDQAVIHFDTMISAFGGHANFGDASR